MRSLLIALSVVLLAAATAGAAQPPYPAFNSSNFVAHVTNQWFPLKPGTTWVYHGIKDGKQTRDVVTVLSRTRLIAGVHATEVRDLLYESGRLEERTSDWYAQDNKGNVWYLGEATAELDTKGHVKNREGSWLTGVHRAHPGIYIPGNPHVGQSALQEYYKGHAEDHFQVVSLATSVAVPYITTHHALLTKEWTPLEPAVLDHKYYVRGIGTVLEASVKGPKEVNKLVSLNRP